MRTALWTNPDDQSSWLYHRWLVGAGKQDIVRHEIADIQALLDEEPNSRCRSLQHSRTTEVLLMCDSCRICRVPRFARVLSALAGQATPGL